MFLRRCLARFSTPFARSLYVQHPCCSKGVHETYIKGRYHKDLPVFNSFKEFIDGFKNLKTEFKLLGQETKELITGDALVHIRQGETYYVWNFDGNEENLKNWIVSSDSDHNEGFSTGNLQLSSAGKGLFSGTLSTVVPKDGLVQTTGYSNITTVRPMKSFMRDAYHEWHVFTHLVLRVRGDGRTYLLNLKCQGYFDMMWNDAYHYILPTRGGPYWQTTKIPFSKFVFGSKGKAQDTQQPIGQERVTQLGITLCDRINGPFNLEIDYIGLEYDESHTEETAYEAYKDSFLIVGV